MNRATFIECCKFKEEIQKVDKNKDLDDIIEMHDNYMARVIQLTLMDNKSKELVRYITEVVEVTQEFRKLVTEYLLNDEQSDSDDGDSDSGMR